MQFSRHKNTADDILLVSWLAGLCSMLAAWFRGFAPPPSVSWSSFFLSPMAFAVPATQTQRCSLTQTEACTCQRCLDQAHWESKPLIITFNRSLQGDLSFFNQREQEPSLHNTPLSCYLADRYNICAESIGENTHIWSAGLLMGQSGLITN